jgi:hypothetical protein
MRRVKSKQLPAGEIPRVAGEFVLRRDVLNAHDVMVFCCPCGCGALTQLRLVQPEAQQRGAPEVPRPRWQLRFERVSPTSDIPASPEPTLAPAVMCTGGCAWHGSLTRGVWEDAEEDDLG